MSISTTAACTLGALHLVHVEHHQNLRLVLVEQLNESSAIILLISRISLNLCRLMPAGDNGFCLIRCRFERINLCLRSVLRYTLYSYLNPRITKPISRRYLITGGGDCHPTLDF